MCPVKYNNLDFWEIYWSGRRDSNPRLQPWQGYSIQTNIDNTLKNYLKY